jgi:2'-5' RNA ligase
MAEFGGRARPEGHSIGDDRPERARLFAALELPELVRDALIGWRLAALEGVSGLRALPSDHLHVTLCFLGWQPVSQIEAVAEACGRLKATGLPELALDEALWLPPRRPRVLAVRLQDDLGRLTAIQAELSVLLQNGGWYEPERRPYLPHVTLARAGRSGRVASSPLPTPPALSFAAPRLTLFRSRLTPGGARYEALAGIELG